MSLLLLHWSRSAGCFLSIPFSACETHQSGTGGSAKQARDRRFQAILPLRGKILNVERKDDASLYKNNEISNLILGLGLGLKGEDVPNLRYGKVSYKSVCSTFPRTVFVSLTWVSQCATPAFC